jgi:acyl-coenzyme A synthetase/AMP-(fatty) acid ligase
MGLQKGDRYLHMFELSFDLSVVSYVLPLQHYGTIYTVSDQNIKYLEIYRLLEEYKLNYAIIVPSVLAMLRPYFEDIDLPELRNVALSGEAVPLKLTEEFQQCCPNAQFHNYYGPTECTIFCTSYKIPRNEIPSLIGIVSIGKATLNQVSKLIREDGSEAANGEKAELYLGGSQVSVGYVKNAEMNLASFLTIDGVNFYKTGDLVIQKNDGLLYYLGRKDQQVKIQGYRIELMEVEHLCKQALKTEAAVVAVKDNRGFDNLVLFVKNDQVWFSEVSPRPHDTGMVTMCSQRLSEFELHARAILGLPVDVSMREAGASAVIYGGIASNSLKYDGLEAALAVPSSDVRLFGKPESFVKRRMGVALATGKDTDEARDRAKLSASLVKPI